MSKTTTLTEEQILDHMLLVADFTSFWDGKIDFTAFSQEEAEHLLAEAAEMVIRIRAELSDRGIEDYSLSGFSKEYLWNLEQLPTEDEFVHSLIHACFKEEGGYICNLSEQEVDALIAKVMTENEKDEEGKKEVGPELLANLKKSLQEAVVDISALEESCPSISTSTLSKELEAMNTHLEEFKRLVRTFQKRMAFKTDATEKLHLRVSGKRQPISRAAAAAEAEQKQQNSEEKAPASQEKQQEQPASEEKAPAQEQKAEGEQKEQSEQKPAGEEATPKPEEQPAQADTPAPSEEVDQKKKGMIEVKQVYDDAAALEAEVREFANSAEGIERVFNFEETNEGLLLVNALQKKGRVYVEHLTRDLLKLDSLPSEGIRTERKNAVMYIQQMLDNLETLQKKLELVQKEMTAREELERSLREKEEKAKKEEQEKQEKAKKEQEAKEQQLALEKQKQQQLQQHQQQQQRQQQLQQRHNAEQEKRQKQQEEIMQRRRVQQEEYERRIEEQRRKVREEEERKIREQEEGKQLIPVNNEDDDDEEIVDLLPHFKNLKLEINFETSKKPEGYFMVANVPGIEEDSIDVRITANKQLVVTGCRLPTKQDLVMMNKVLDQRFQFISQRERINALLRMGAGRYGTFEEIYRLPPNVLSNKIEARYLNGHLRIFLPVPQQPPQAHIPVGTSPYASGYQPFGGRTRGYPAPGYGGYGGYYDQPRYWR